MWALARRLLAGFIVMSLEETRRVMSIVAARNRMNCEGAGPHVQSRQNSAAKLGASHLNDERRVLYNFWFYAN